MALTIGPTGAGRDLEGGEQRAAVGKPRQRILHRQLAQLAHLRFQAALVGFIAALFADAAGDEYVDAEREEAGEQHGLGRRNGAVGIGKRLDEREDVVVTCDQDGESHDGRQDHAIPEAVPGMLGDGLNQRPRPETLHDPSLVHTAGP